jgi:hypothetical protein
VREQGRLEKESRHASSCDKYKFPDTSHDEGHHHRKPSSSLLNNNTTLYDSRLRLLQLLLPTTTMHFQKLALVFALSAIGLAQDVDQDDVPMQCRDVCSSVTSSKS